MLHLRHRELANGDMCHRVNACRFEVYKVKLHQLARPGGAVIPL